MSDYPPRVRGKHINALFARHATTVCVALVVLIAASAQTSGQDFILVGDMNADGEVNTGDVAPFVLALTDREAYLAEFFMDEQEMVARGDINQDGEFNTGDVAPFVSLLTGVNGSFGAAGPSVPEPGTLALVMFIAPMILARRRHGVHQCRS